MTKSEILEKVIMIAHQFGGDADTLSEWPSERRDRVVAFGLGTLVARLEIDVQAEEEAARAQSDPGPGSGGVSPSMTRSPTKDDTIRTNDSA